MSRLETEIGSIQDDLPEEVLRELQVEEAWARRKVLADLINAERLSLYASKRAFFGPDRLKAPDLVRERPAARSWPAVVPFRGRKASA